MNNKVVLIGIDGGTFDFINPLVKASKLPNISAFLNEGVYGSLSTTLPSSTVPAWVSCVTGVNPGKHGVFYFTDPIPGSDRLLNASAVKAKSIWHYLGQAGKKSILITVPFTYPIEDLNGISISFAKSKMAIDFYPPEVYDEVISHLILKDQPVIRPARLKTKSKEELLETIVDYYLDIIDKIKQIVIYLSTKYEWDFLMAVFSSTDVLQHHLLCYLDKNHPMYDDRLADKYGDKIYEAYMRIDNALGEIMASIGNNCTYIVVSDHGIGPTYKHIYINSLLEKLGLLVLKPKYRRIGLRFLKIAEILSRLNLHFLCRTLPTVFLNCNVPVVFNHKKLTSIIDWNSTKVYFKEYGIRVNLKGRDPIGVVETGEYEDLIAKITNSLYSLRDPDTGERIIKKVHRTSELYPGPYSENGMDLILEFKKSNWIPQDSITPYIFSNISKKQRICAHHLNYKSDGILLMRGIPIRKGHETKTPNIVDIATNVLYLIDLPIPEQLDGKVLTDSFRYDFLTQRPPSIIPMEISRISREHLLLPEEEDKIRKQLRELGYIE